MSPRSCSPVSPSSVSRSDLVAALEHARERTEGLLDPLSDEQLTRQVSPLQSPLVWDLAHIGYFEELWLLRRVGGRAAVSPKFDDLYDSFAHPRNERGGLPILAPDAARAYVSEVREAVLGLLPEVSFNGGDPLLEGGFVVGMVAQHELQHAETMTQTLALAGLPEQGPPEVRASGEATVPAGPFTLGSTEPWAYDNERPAHVVDLPAFRIDRALVTNGEYAAFVEDGAAAPPGWDPAARPNAPVQHVSFDEAEAYAEYSEAFFGSDYRVLRGGSWFTDPLVARLTFRNWDLPQRRQIFSGLRCARDV